MYNIHPTDFLIFSFDREAFQSKVLFQRPRWQVVSFPLPEDGSHRHPERRSVGVRKLLCRNESEIEYSF